MSPALISLVILFTCQAFGRRLEGRAQNLLSLRERLLLGPVFGGWQNLTKRIVIFLLILILASPALFPGYSRRVTLVALVGFLVYLIVMQLWTARQFRLLTLPPEYRRMVMLGRSIRTIGIVALIWANLVST